MARSAADSIRYRASTEGHAQSLAVFGTSDGYNAAMRLGAAAIAIIGTCMLGGCAASRHSESPSGPSRSETPGASDLIGSWDTTSGLRSLIISIHQDGQALVLFMQPGQHTIKHVGWEPFHGGILIQDVNRIRLWPGEHPNELRAEFEAAPSTHSGEALFPKRFAMRRVSERQIPAELLNRPVPEHWRRAQVE